MKKIVVALLQSRKAWLTLLSVASSIGMYLHHMITADQLSNVLAGSMAVLIFSIAHEDRGAPQTIAAGGDVTVTPTAVPSGDVGKLAAAEVKPQGVMPGTSALR